MILTKRHTAALRLLKAVLDINETLGFGPTKRGVIEHIDSSTGSVTPQGTKRHHYRTLTDLVDNGYLVNLGYGSTYNLYVTSAGLTALYNLCGVDTKFGSHRTKIRLPF